MVTPLYHPPEARPIRLTREQFSEPPTLDTAVSAAILRRVSEGLDPETLRIHRPAAIVAFGPKDRTSPGYPQAVAAAERHGFAVVERLAGGRAAVFHERIIAFSWVVPDTTPRQGIRERFDEIASILTTAFRSLGVDAGVGSVPGEYCPGDHSVNARGRTKLAGVGQRLVQRAAHVGGVIVVGESARIRDVLVPVYEALGLAWDPRTVGSLEDELGTVGWDDVERAILDAFAERHALTEETLSAETVAEARILQPRFLPDIVPKAQPNASRTA